MPTPLPRRRPQPSRRLATFPNTHSVSHGTTHSGGSLAVLCCRERRTSGTTASIFERNLWPTCDGAPWSAGPRPGRPRYRESTLFSTLPSCHVSTASTSFAFLGSLPRPAHKDVGLSVYLVREGAVGCVRAQTPMHIDLRRPRLNATLSAAIRHIPTLHRMSSHRALSPSIPHYDCWISIASSSWGCRCIWFARWHSVVLRVCVRAQSLDLGRPGVVSRVFVSRGGTRLCPSTDPCTYPSPRVWNQCPVRVQEVPSTLSVAIQHPASATAGGGRVRMPDRLRQHDRWISARGESGGRLPYSLVRQYFALYRR